MPLARNAGGRPVGRADRAGRASVGGQPGGSWTAGRMPLAARRAALRLGQDGPAAAVTAACRGGSPNELNVITIRKPVRVDGLMPSSLNTSSRTEG